MLKRLIVFGAILVPTVGWAASSNVNSLSASGAIVGSQQLYCPTTAAGADLKCTFTQVDAFIASTAASWSALQTFPTGNIAIGYPVTVATVTSGGIPYFSSTTAEASSALLAANAFVLGGGAGTAPATTTTGTGVVTAVGNAVNTTGGLVTQSGTLAASAVLLGGGASTAITSTTTGTGVVTGIGAAVNSTTSGSLATTAVPLTVGTGGTISTGDGYYVCTTTCAITLPTPAAGFQFCIRNDSAVTTVITISAITSVQFEKTTYNGYGTVTTGTMVSGGALGDKVCLVGRDATHYLVGSYVGTWTNS